LNLPEIDASIRAGAKRALDQRVVRLSAKLESEGTLYAGKPAEVLIRLTDSVDILVIGSRGYGPLTGGPPWRRVGPGDSFGRLPGGCGPTRGPCGARLGVRFAAIDLWAAEVPIGCRGRG
jgi:hypothetical protein